MTTSTSNNYQVGGTLPHDNPHYIERQADKTLYENIINDGHFCYVLSSRQMGKSSLLISIMHKLKSEGFNCCKIDFLGICEQGINAKKMYLGIIYELADHFKIFTKSEFNDWLSQYSELSSIDKLRKFIDVVQTKISGKIVIFVDEIDTVLNLNFECDDFFGLIREIYNKRAENPEYNRLVFTIFGVASLSGLVSDSEKAPFNIGKSIELDGFQLQEVSPLAAGISGFCQDVDKVMEEILNWTGGQPFLTHKLCQLIFDAGEYISIGKEAEYIQRIVWTKIIDNWEIQDQPMHLRSIRDRLSPDRLLDHQHKINILGLRLYQKILQEGEIPSNDSKEQINLRLSGLVVRDPSGKKLIISNRIYQNIFNQSWVAEILYKLRPDGYRDKIKKWVESDQQDKSVLLRGQSLKEALNWAEKNSLGLSDEDYQFLTACQELETKKAKEDSRNVIKITILIFFGVITGVFLFTESLIILRRSNDLLEINQESYKASQNFENHNRQIKALMKALKADYKLKSLYPNINFAQDYPISKPLFTLQTILEKIQQKDIFLNKDQYNKFLSTIPVNSHDLKEKYDKLCSNSRYTGKKEIASLSNDKTYQAILDRKDIDNDLIKMNSSEDRKELDEYKERYLDICDISFFVPKKPYPKHKYPLAIFKTNHGVDITYLNSQKKSDSVSPSKLFPNKDDFNSAIFSNNADFLFTNDPNYVIRIFSRNGLLASSLDKTSASDILNISDDGKLLLTIDKSNNPSVVNIWRVSNKRLQKQPSILNDPNTIRAIFTPDNQRIITGTKDGYIKIWDFSTKKIQFQFQTKSYQGEVISIASSTNGKLIATLGDEYKIKIWQNFGDHLVLQSEYDSPYGENRIIRFNKDGKILGILGGSRNTNSKDSTDKIMLLKLYEDNEIQELAEFIPNNNDLDTFDFVFSPSQAGEDVMMVSEYKNSRITTWPIKNLDKLITQGCEWLQEYRDIHPQEKKELSFCDDSQ